MSNHLAIATVTATLQRLLQSVVQRDVDGARVTTLKPGAIGNSTPESGVNLFLYQTAANLALRNGDTKVFRSKAKAIRRTTTLDLFYMLSAYGNEAELEPQRLIGSVVRALSDKTVLSPEMIGAAIADATFLEDSDLVDHATQLTISPVDMDSEEFSKVWSTFLQAPYTLSVPYKVMAVVIDGEQPTERALPVRDRHLGGGVTPFPQQPVLTQVVSERGTHVPIERKSMLRLVGTGLGCDRAQVQIGDFPLNPAAVTDSEILVSLGSLPSDVVRAGIQSARVLHHLSNRSEAIPTASNAIPFVLRPAVLSVDLLQSEGIDDDPRSGMLALTTDVTIDPEQRVVVMLNEWSTARPESYTFGLSPRTNSTKSLQIPFENVQPGEYLVRLQVDGADSLLSVDSDPSSQTFNWFNGPRVVIE